MVGYFVHVVLGRVTLATAQVVQLVSFLHPHQHFLVIVSWALEKETIGF